MWEGERGEGRGKRAGRRMGGGLGIERTIIIIIANDHLLHLAVPAHLAPKILVEGVEMVLQLAGVHLIFWVVGWVLV